MFYGAVKRHTHIIDQLNQSKWFKLRMSRLIR